MQNKSRVTWIVLLVLLAVAIAAITYAHTQATHPRQAPPLTALEPFIDQPPIDPFQIKQCDVLNVPTKMNASSIATANTVLGSKRLKQWQPDPPNLRSQDPRYDYCYINDDASTSMQDFILGGKACNKTNPLFTNTPFIADAFSSTSRDKPFTQASQKCVIKIDKQQVAQASANQLNAFWSGYDDTDCDKLAQYFVSLRDSLSNQYYACMARCALIDNSNIVLRNLIGVQDSNIAVLNYNQTICQQTRTLLTHSIDTTKTIRDAYARSNVSLERVCNATMAAYTSSNNECGGWLHDALSDLETLTRNINRKEAELSDLYRNYDTLKVQHRDLAALLQIEQRSNEMLIKWFDAVVESNAVCTSNLLQCKFNLSNCTACNQLLEVEQEKWYTQAVTLSNTYTRTCAEKDATEKVLITLCNEVVKMEDSHRMCSLQLQICTRELSGYTVSNNQLQGLIDYWESMLPCKYTSNEIPFYESKKVSEQETMSEEKASTACNMSSYVALKNAWRTEMDSNAKACVPDSMEIKDHYVSCDRNSNCQICNGSIAAKECPKICKDMFPTKSNVYWNNKWAVLTQLRGVCGCSYIGHPTDLITAKATAKKFEDLAEINFTCDQNTFYSSAYTDVIIDIDKNNTFFEQPPSRTSFMFQGIERSAIVYDSINEIDFTNHRTVVDRWVKPIVQSASVGGVATRRYPTLDVHVMTPFVEGSVTYFQRTLKGKDYTTVAATKSFSVDWIDPSKSEKENTDYVDGYSGIKVWIGAAPSTGYTNACPDENFYQSFTLPNCCYISEITYKRKYYKSGTVGKINRDDIYGPEEYCHMQRNGPYNYMTTNPRDSGGYFDYLLTQFPDFDRRYKRWGLKRDLEQKKLLDPPKVSTEDNMPPEIPKDKTFKIKFANNGWGTEIELKKGEIKLFPSPGKTDYYNASLGADADVDKVMIRVFEQVDENGNGKEKNTVDTNYVSKGSSLRADFACVGGFRSPNCVGFNWAKHVYLSAQPEGRNANIALVALQGQ